MADRPFAASAGTHARRGSHAAAFRALRALLAGAVLAGSLSFAPASALASRLRTDRVGGVPRSAG